MPYIAWLSAATNCPTLSRGRQEPCRHCYMLVHVRRLRRRFCAAPGSPSAAFLKGGTSLSKSFGLIGRFSEDIDVTVFRDDLGEAASMEELGTLSGKKRRARFDAIKQACQVFIGGPRHRSPMSWPQFWNSSDSTAATDALL